MNVKYPVINVPVPSVMQRFPILIPFILGMALNFISVISGNPYLISLIGVVVACVVTIVWADKPLPWIILVSVVAANPLNNSTTISLNLIFSLVFLVLNIRYLKRLPRLLLPVIFITLLSVLGSVLNWSFGISSDSFLTQGAAVTNYILGPFLLIPLIYTRIQENHDGELLLKGLVFALIVPSVSLLALAYSFGHPVSTNLKITSQFHYAVNLETYLWGNTEFRFIRTQVGFILASMICASFAVVINNVSWMLRLTAAACFTIAAFLLLTTGSMGSSLACLCGIALILIVGKRYLSIKRYVIVVLAIVGFVFVAWSVLPEGIQKYVESRYMERFSQGGVDASDRISIWKNSFAFLMDNPMGVGWSLPIEAQQLGYSSHNDYLAYAMSYGFSCGLLYMFVPAWLLFSLSTVKSRVLDFARLIVILAGVGVVTSLLVNSFSDHLAANRWYYNVVWSIVWYAFFLSKRSLQPSSKKIGHNLAYRRHK